METTGQDQAGVEGENQPAEIPPSEAAQVKPPPPVPELSPPPIIWPPAAVPHHSTEIRDWGINE